MKRSDRELSLTKDYAHTVEFLDVFLMFALFVGGHVGSSVSHHQHQRCLVMITLSLYLLARVLDVGGAVDVSCAVLTLRTK